MDKQQKEVHYLSRAYTYIEMAKESMDLPELEHASDHEDLIMAAATYEMYPSKRGDNPSSWPFPDSMPWVDHVQQFGLQGRHEELIRAALLYHHAVDIMTATALETPLLDACKHRIAHIAEELSRVLRKVKIKAL